MTRTLDRFLADLPKFVSGFNSVVVATYNNLRSYEKGGEINTVGGRKISIFCGGAAYANVEILFGYYKPNTGAQATKAVGAKIVSDNLAQVGTDSLVILYAGKSRFSEMIQLAYHLAERGIKIVLIGCGCEMDVFDHLNFNENISLVIPTHGECNGGRDDLSAVVKKLLN